MIRVLAVMMLTLPVAGLCEALPAARLLKIVSRLGAFWVFSR